MDIIEETYDWAKTLYDIDPSKVEYIVEHHIAGKGFSAQEIHAFHLSKGWSGIAYHLYVRQDGTVYRGRPIDKKGGHAENYNSVSIGICAEGNFDIEGMSDVQKKALIEATQYVKSIYPNAKVVRHSDLNATACPGKNYPFEQITSTESEDELEMTKAELISVAGTGDNPSEWAREATEKMKELGVFNGDGQGNYGWQQAITREAVATVLANFAEKMGL